MNIHALIVLLAFLIRQISMTYSSWKGNECSLKINNFGEGKKTHLTSFSPLSRCFHTMTGTVISTAVTGMICWGFLLLIQNQWTNLLPELGCAECIFFGAIISATGNQPCVKRISRVLNWSKPIIACMHVLQKKKALRPKKPSVTDWPTNRATNVQTDIMDSQRMSCLFSRDNSIFFTEWDDVSATWVIKQIYPPSSCLDDILPLVVYGSMVNICQDTNKGG